MWRSMARSQGNGQWKYRMAQWMMGRYGIDQLTQALMIVACVVILINFFAHSSILSTVALLLMGWGIFRCYSRNVQGRARELAKYQELMVKPNLYFKCKGCGAVLNVPKGKGKLLVTCPKCGTKVEKRS